VTGNVLKQYQSTQKVRKNTGFNYNKNVHCLIKISILYNLLCFDLSYGSFSSMIAFPFNIGGVLPRHHSPVQKQSITAFISYFFHFRGNLLEVFESNSPWYNCTGWLGIKYHLTYLLTYLLTYCESIYKLLSPGHAVNQGWLFTGHFSSVDNIHLLS